MNVTRTLAAFTALAVGLVGGVTLSHSLGLHGHNVAITRATVSPDGRTLVVWYTNSHARIRLTETPTSVLLRARASGPLPSLCFTCSEPTSVVHLSAPLGIRTLIDEGSADGVAASAVHVLRPAHLPFGFIHASDDVTFGANGLPTSTIEAYISARAFMTITEATGATPALDPNLTVRGRPAVISDNRLEWQENGETVALELRQAGDQTTVQPQLITLANLLQ